MKNALILHGIENNHTGNWFPWLTQELEHQGYRVFAADLPKPERPNISRSNAYIFANWTLDSESIIIGHSSGAVAALGALQSLPEHIVIRACFLVAGFTDPLGDGNSELFLQPLNYPYIRNRSKKFVLVHSDTDPYVPLWHGEKLHEYLGGELCVIPGQGHFNLEMGPQYKQFPWLLQKILQ